MKPGLVLLLIGTWLSAGVAIGLSIGSLTYGERLATQAAIILQQNEVQKQHKLILDAWKKAAAACEFEHNKEAK